MAGHSHRSSVKNGHKSFKSKHSTKGALKRMNKGKVEREDRSGKCINVITKLQRKNLAKQQRANKIIDSLEVKKLFDGVNGAEKIITVVTLTDDIYADDIVKKLVSCSFDQDEEDMDWEINIPSITNYRVKKFKSNLKFIIPDMNNLINILDCAKVADFVIFGLSGTSEVDPKIGEQIIRALELQGIASYIGVVPNLSKVHPKEKFQLDVKQSLESYFKHFFPSENHIYNLEKKTEALNGLRNICQKYPRQIHWRDNRGYMVADEVNFLESSQDLGQLVISGTVRGIGFHSNRLIHLPSLGDFQISKIERLSCSPRNKSKGELNSNVEFFPDGEQDTLEEYASQDFEMDGEFDNEFEYDKLTSARYDNHGFLPNSSQKEKRVKLPKGTSEYQSRWYLDDVESSDDEIENDSVDMEIMEEANEDFMMDIGDSCQIESNFDKETEELNEMFVDLSPEEESRELEKYRMLEKEDREFPDEIELNPSESGIDRLKRYRGLKNLHNCVWSVDEKDPLAPVEWKRILRIGNYKYTKNKLLKQVKLTTEVIAGDRVKIYIKFSKAMLGKILNPSYSLLALYSLLPHEHKNALVNFSIQRWDEFEDPVPSQESLFVQYGPRRYEIQPLFSSSSNTPNNIHKYDNFLHPNTISIASCIAPIDFTQSPAIFFKPSSADSKGFEFIGHGTFLNADHTRIIAKRVILTGHPFKFHKTVITVRYMFFRPDDVEWFKSIPLFTKSGRTGFIKESLGTHGYFKAVFDGKLSAQDTVAMALFTRVWPKISSPCSI